MCVRVCEREREREIKIRKRIKRQATDESFNSSGLVSELLNGKNTKHYQYRTQSVSQSVSQSASQMICQYDGVEGALSVKQTSSSPVVCTKALLKT